MLFVLTISAFLLLVGVLELKRALGRNRRKIERNGIIEGYKQALDQNDNQEIELYEQSFRKTKTK